MTKILCFKQALLMAAWLALPATQAGAQMPSPTLNPLATPSMSKVDYQSARTRIKAEYKADKAACSAQSGNAKDICVEQGKAKEKVALADLTYGYSAKATDHNKALVAKAEATYAVAKERCDDLSGNPKDVCVKQAKAVEIKALADAKMGRDINEARKDAATEKRDADYQVAIEKCDALTSEAKAKCIASAKLTFGKT